MNLFILVIILLMLTLGVIALCNGDVIEPLPLSFASFLTVSVIAFAYNGFFGYDINSGTVLYILVALFVYAFGYIATKAILQKTQLNKFSTKLSLLPTPSKYFSVSLLALGIVSFIISFRHTLGIAKTISSNVSADNMLLYARNAELFTTVEHNAAISIASFFIAAAGYFYTYILIQTLVLSSQKRTVIFRKFYIEIIIIIVSLLISALGTGRTFLIKYISFAIVATYYLKYFKNRSSTFSAHSVLKTIRTMIVVLIVFFTIFQLLGITTNKTSQVSATDMLYTYSGSSIIALDRSIYTYKDDGRFFGEESFYGLYGFLNTLGCDIPNNILHLPFIQAADGIKTNIYTSLRTYIYDFGVSGALIIQFILGIVSAAMYVLLKRLGGNPIYLLLYAILIYGTAMQGVAEITLRNLMSITNVCLVTFYILMCIVTSVKFMKYE